MGRYDANQPQVSKRCIESREEETMINIHWFFVKV
jgi:hypothetical protein